MGPCWLAWVPGRVQGSSECQAPQRPCTVPSGVGSTQGLRPQALPALPTAVTPLVKEGNPCLEVCVLWGQAPLKQRAPCSNVLFLVEEGQGEKGWHTELGDLG